ncbi:long-chain-fatty-acid-CoA ligase [Micromonospora sp. ATCC 39149]|uniref:Acyl-CoA ligase (AMP-forming) n=1 Tax=Micromonospora carbonacea TaxID=47853 RepID=A0A7D5Y7D9_9ACTN|nr:acyl-CoA ligase (AMP-forming), exosortase A system-associated [Micromonospora sp. ATCC 39149]EEP71458.1 long-chain-fatty-acid-CoA ligase [Micromonospora sp. ATCC 39149]QLJ97721.1 acyl-CoA ligase (AMP-forming) [Micromonospora carbonacea]
MNIDHDCRPRVGPSSRTDHLADRGADGHPALSHRTETISYAALRQRVDRAADGLRRRGIGRGDRVLVYADKRIETVVAMLAVAATGGVFVPVNPQFKKRQLAHVIGDCAPRALVTVAERLATVRAAGGDRVEHLLTLDGLAAEAAFSTGGATTATVDAGTVETDPAAIFYTSGSTGPPKGVVVSHRNLIAGAESVAGYLAHRADDVILSVLPLSFDAGFSQVTTALAAGAHLVLATYLRPGQVASLCARHRVTGLTCVPPMWRELAAVEWPAEAAASLRYFASTGGAMPRTTLNGLRRRFPRAKPFLMYGLTEAFRSTYLDPAEVDLRPGSIGKAIPNADVRVLRPDGTECEPGERGELVHRGATVALGYWNSPEATAQRFRPVQPGNPGLREEVAVWSGDLAYRDEDGFLYFLGRTDEMIKTSGYRVSPTEVESAALATGLATEAVAFGAEDEKLGQRIVLVVTSPCDTARLTEALRETLPSYQLPRTTVVVPELPRSPNGKYDRVALRRTILEAPA